MNGSVSDRRVVVVTGSSSGIGAATARLLTQRGDRVVIVGRPPAVRAVMNSPLRLALRSPARGADTIVWLATSMPDRDWRSGGYFADRKPATPSPLADDPKLAERLWDRSASMCGL